MQPRRLRGWITPSEPGRAEQLPSELPQQHHANSAFLLNIPQVKSLMCPIPQGWPRNLFLKERIYPARLLLSEKFPELLMHNSPL